MSRANSLETALHIADATIRNLESQNQALQERLEAMTAERDAARAALALPSPTEALQERAEKAEAALAAYPACGEPACIERWALRWRVRPTQETDPG